MFDRCFTLRALAVALSFSSFKSDQLAGVTDLSLIFENSSRRLDGAPRISLFAARHPFTMLQRHLSECRQVGLIIDPREIISRLSAVFSAVIVVGVCHCRATNATSDTIFHCRRLFLLASRRTDTRGSIRVCVPIAFQFRVSAPVNRY